MWSGELYIYIYIYIYKCGAPGTGQGPESRSPGGGIYNIEGPSAALGSDVPFQVLQRGYLGSKMRPKCVLNEANKSIFYLLLFFSVF